MARIYAVRVRLVDDGHVHPPPSAQEVAAHVHEAVVTTDAEVNASGWTIVSIDAEWMAH